MSWNSYRMVDYDPPTDLAIAPIVKSMKLFEKYFKVNAHPIPHPTLWVWELELEEKKQKYKRRSGRESAQKTLPPVIRKYMFALSFKEELLFTNKVLIKKVGTILSTALHCSKFELLPLTHGTPSNLVLLYTQAKDQRPGVLEIQYQNKVSESVEQLKNGLPVSSCIEDSSEKVCKTNLQLGSYPEKIPKIKKVTVALENVPVKSKNPKLKGFRFDEMDMEVAAPSVFHLYQSLAEQGVITKIPAWLEKMRARGQTHCDVHYN